MEINILKPDNEIVLVDKNRFDELYSSAEMNEKQIEERAEELFFKVCQRLWNRFKI